MVSSLVDIFRRESLTFLQYVRQSCPYVSIADRELAERLKSMADSERQLVAELADYLDKKRVTLPHVGAFASTFTNFNFIAVRKLLPELIADQKRQITNLERDLNGVPSTEQGPIPRLLNLKQAHLTELEKL